MADNAPAREDDVHTALHDEESVVSEAAGENEPQEHQEAAENLQDQVTNNSGEQTNVVNEEESNDKDRSDVAENTESIDGEKQEGNAQNEDVNTTSEGGDAKEENATTEVVAKKEEIEMEDGEIEEDDNYIPMTTKPILPTVAKVTPDTSGAKNVAKSPLELYQRAYKGIMFTPNSTQVPEIQVLNIPPTAVEDDLRVYFTEFGIVTHCVLASNTARITFTDIAALNRVFAEPEHEIKGNFVIVKPSPPILDRELEEQNRAQYDNHGVHLAGLIPTMTENMVKSEMCVFGVIANVNLILQPKEGSEFGYGFVTYEDKDSAVKAITAATRKIDGHEVKISMTRKPTLRVGRTHNHNHRLDSHPYGGRGGGQQYMEDYYDRGGGRGRGRGRGPGREDYGFPGRDESFYGHGGRGFGPGGRGGHFDHGRNYDYRPAGILGGRGPYPIAHEGYQPPFRNHDPYAGPSPYPPYHPPPQNNGYAPPGHAPPGYGQPPYNGPPQYQPPPSQGYAPPQQYAPGYNQPPLLSQPPAPAPRPYNPSPYSQPGQYQAPSNPPSYRPQPYSSNYQEPSAYTPPPAQGYDGGYIPPPTFRPYSAPTQTYSSSTSYRPYDQEPGTPTYPPSNY